MGIVLTYQCTCGYRREVCIGAGIRAMRTDILPTFFSDDELTDFYRSENSGEVTEQLCENIFAFCPACNDYHDVPFFHYTCRDGSTHFLTGACPECGNTVVRVKETDSITCPDCLKLITAVQTGRWD